jgi:hypothetical protein
MQSSTTIPSWPRSIVLPVVGTAASFALFLLKSHWWWHNRGDLDGAAIRLPLISLFVWLVSLAAAIVTGALHHEADRAEAVICTLNLFLSGLAACLAVSSILPGLNSANSAQV